MDDPVDRTIATYESVAEQYRARHADRSGIDTLVERFLDALDGGPVLDVGCGPGWETATFASCGHEVVGVDLTQSFLSMAASDVPRASFARMDMRRLGFDDDSFGGLWACASFLHVPRSDARSTLVEFERVLQPEGTLHLSVQRGEGERDGQSYEGDTRRFVLYSPSELRDLLTAVGFSVEVTTDGGWVQALATT